MITIESEIPRFRSIELDLEGEYAGKIKAVLRRLGISYKETYELDSYEKGTVEYFASDDINQVIRDALREK